MSVSSNFILYHPPKMAQVSYHLFIWSVNIQPLNNDIYLFLIFYPDISCFDTRGKSEAVTIAEF